MPRKYSKELISLVKNSDENNLGNVLAQECLKANLPAIYVAKTLKVSRMTIHSWFRGSPIRYKNSKNIEAFIKLVKAGTQAGRLPAKTMMHAKFFLKDIEL